MNLPIRDNVEKLTPYVPGEQPRDPGIVKLNTNENPFPPVSNVGRAMAALSSETLRLYPDPVCRALREEAARIHGVSPDQVLFGNGSDEVLAYCTRAFVPDGMAIGYFDPSYSLYPVLARIADHPVVTTPLHDDFSCPDPVAEGVSLFFWTNPNAPTSVAAPPEQIRAFANRFNGIVVVDEAYADFATETCESLLKDCPNLLITRTFSKSHSLAWIRLGYIMGSPALIGALYKIKDSYNINGVTQALGLAALQGIDDMRETAARIVGIRDRFRLEIEGLGFEVHPSQTNFLFARPPDGRGAECAEFLKHHKIFVRYFPGPVTGAYIRITIGTEAQMSQLLGLLRQFVGG